MEIVPDLIPSWLLGIIIIYTGIAWLLPKAHLCRSCRNIFASGFIIWGAVFGILFELFPLDLETRGFISRTMILIICLSQSIPLTIYHIRSVLYDRENVSQ